MTMKNQIKELHFQGLSDPKIGAALGVHKTTVRRVRIALGLKAHPRSKVTVRLKNVARKLFHQGWSDVAVAQRIHVSKSAARRLRHQLNAPKTSPEFCKERQLKGARRFVDRKRRNPDILKVAHARRLEAARMGWPGFRPDQAQLLELLREHGPLSKRDLAMRLSLRPRQIHHRVWLLERENVVERCGSKREHSSRQGGYAALYQLSDKGRSLCSFIPQDEKPHTRPFIPRIHKAARFDR